MTISDTGLARPATPAATAKPAPAGRAKVSSIHYKPGMLLQGSDDDVFYLTEAGTRRRIYDQATFQAFGFVADYIVKVDDELLEMLPLAEELTRLVRYPQGNLYWVMDGQRWLVNEWLAVVSQADYADVPVTLLDSWLEHSLPVRLNFENGLLLAEADEVYYFNSGAIVPVTNSIAPKTNVIEAPAGVLAVYEQKTQLEAVYLPLNAETPAVVVHQGPGRQYETLGAIANKVMVEGRSEDGRWLRVRYQEQAGWLAAEQLADPVGPNLLSVVAAAGTGVTGLPQAQAAAMAGHR
jgi:hypothetical protein